ncbi:anti-sigma regulatory factor [Amycolatopsis antarctica]|uniref:Anti-sigma regulatory factor n=1 Tax=Amycolatopsis antarctica TaxID=1854586 RepID=A0A263CXR0_9PSEU|nr:ATP-binding protein [Amycolatopsis antarctica]OZM70116.1 anti-sigma regulatory factor [Amycolatopsis antarctica]
MEEVMGMTAPGVSDIRDDADGTLSLELATEQRAPSVARHAVAEVLRALDVSEDLKADILLVTSELVTNAVEHGGAPTHLRVERKGRELAVRVTDGGGGTPAVASPDPLTERSRGLWLVDALAQEWRCEELSEGKEIVALFRW